MKNTLIVMFLFFGIFIVGCGGVDSASDEPQASAIPGPVSYSMIKNVFESQGVDSIQNTTSFVRATGGNIPLYTGLAINFFPATAPVLGTINAISSFIGVQQTQQEINQLINTVNIMQNQISALQSQLNLDQSIFYQYMLQEQGKDDNNWIFQYYSSDGYDSILGDDGAYAHFTSIINSESPSDVINNSMTSLNTFAVENSSSWLNVLQNMSSANVPLNCGTSCYKEVTQTALSGEYQSSLQQTYNAMYQYLEVNMPVIGTESSTNLVDILDSYNNNQTGLFQQTTVTLQAAYTIEAAINYYNFLSTQAAISESSATAPQQISNISGIPSTYYTYSSSSLAIESQNFQNFQENLACYMLRGLIC